MKVYGWRSFRAVVGQSREIVAAKSVAEVLRITGLTRYQWNLNGCETGNAEEIAQATKAPGQIFWRSINAREGDPWAYGGGLYQP